MRNIAFLFVILISTNAICSYPPFSSCQSNPQGDLDCQRFLDTLPCGPNTNRSQHNETVVYRGGSETPQYYSFSFQTITYGTILCTGPGGTSSAGGGCAIFNEYCNYGYPKNADQPGNTSSPENPIQQCSIRKKGSIINVSNQTFGEKVDLVGSPFALYYSSLNDPGRIQNRRIYYKYEYPQSAVPFSIKVFQDGDVLETLTLPAISPMIYEKVWDGKDKFGNINPFVDSSLFKIVLGSSYSAGSGPTDGNSDFFGKEYSLVSYKPVVWGLGGFTLSVHNFYDPRSHVIFYGDGTTSVGQFATIIDPVYGSVFVGPNSDESEVYIFDMLGKHLETRTPLLNALLYKFNYDAQNRLVSVVDQNGNTTSFVRDSSGLLKKVVAPFGQETSVSINSSGKISSVTDPEERTHLFEYQNGSGLMTKVTYPSGLETSIEYDSLGQLLKESDSAGFFHTFVSTVSDTLKTIVYATVSGVQEVYNYTSDGLTNKVTVSTVDGQISETTVQDNKFSVVTPAGTTTTTISNDARWGSALQYVVGVNIYNPYSGSIDAIKAKTVSLADPANPLTLSSMTEITKVSTQSDATVVFSADTKTISATSSSGIYSLLQFDPKERPSIISQDGQLATIFNYNPNGLLVSMSQGTKTQSFVYNDKGHLVQTTDSRGKSTYFEYNLNGQVTKETLPNNDYTSYEYSEDGTVSKITVPGNKVHQFTHNLLSQISSYTAPLLSFFGIHSNTIYNYDLDRRISSVQKPSGATTTINYKPSTNFVQSIVTPQGTYQFNNIDSQGRPAEIISPDGIRMVLVWSGGYISTIHTYDGAVDLGQLYYLWDNFGRISRYYVQAPGGAEVDYTYDADSRIIAVDGETYAYHQTTSQNSNGDGTFTTIASRGYKSNFNYRWSQAVEHKDFDVPQGSDAMVSQDISEFVFNDYSNHSLAKFTFEDRRDVSGDIQSSSVAATGIPGQASTFSFESKSYLYDDNSRLTEVSLGSQRLAKNGQMLFTPKNVTANYQFNPGSNGNVATYQHGSRVTSATYDSQDRLTKLTGSISRDFAYTADGDLQTISNCLGTKRFSYDAVGNLKQVTMPDGKVISYKVDGFNRRVARYVNGQPDEYYMWYNKLQLAAVLSPTGSVLIQYFYGPNPYVPTHLSKPDGQYKIIANSHGDILYLINAYGYLKQEIHYDEYGNVLSDSSIVAPGQKPFQPLGYASGLTDPDTKLIRFGARDYDPSIGRWTAKDPIGFDGGDTNLYGYVENDPINWIDPEGTNKRPGQVMENDAVAGGGGGTGGSANVVATIRPNGQLIGEPGSSSRVRIVPGGLQEAQNMYGGLCKGGTLSTPSNYSGQMVRFSDGGVVGLRSSSRSGPPTIDINVPGMSGIKIKFTGE